MKMFAKATRKFVAEVDPDGVLIPVFRRNEADNLKLLSLVVKRNGHWFWQRPKYMPLDFTLDDVLAGDKSVDPGVIETDFLKYNSTLENNTRGEAEADFGPGNIHLEGKGSSKLASSFGQLKKQEIDVQHLLNNCKDRTIDLQHSLVQQIQEKRREVLTLVKERIITTQPCTLTEVVQEGGSCGAFLGLSFTTRIQVTLKNGSHQSDSNISLEIPAKTALAYCLIELNVKSNGDFDLCLLPGSSGSFKADVAVRPIRSLRCSGPPETPNEQLKRELDALQVHFKLLSELPDDTRSSLFQQLTLLLKDKEAISVLHQALEDLCSGKEPEQDTLYEKPEVKTVVELLRGSRKEDGGSVADQQFQSSPLIAAHVLCSALEELLDSDLSALQSCCCSSIIHALRLLVENVAEDNSRSLKDGTLAALENDSTYGIVKQLFSSSNITLCKEDDSICAVVSTQQGHLALILSISICGLASLAPPV